MAKKSRGTVSPAGAPAEIIPDAPADVTHDAPADTLPGVSVAPQGPELPAVYIVAGLKSITSSRGVLSPGDKVTPSSFGPGVFEAMIDAGAIVRA
jgi:hypothetical protein